MREGVVVVDDHQNRANLIVGERAAVDFSDWDVAHAVPANDFQSAPVARFRRVLTRGP